MGELSFRKERNNGVKVPLDATRIPRKTVAGYVERCAVATVRFSRPTEWRP
jgi:hypothetical protein